ncbi:ribosome production factor 2 homolog [Caerostris darwini]|uniref:Ribosome production factor 2 homolog n=1 Tax=Caerostris darwini TaxID=1538125 RepID=A0AAV4S7B4_9ARAC|nr:ribosome production factor 2 homolog [Caerostris darwini]
MEFKVNKPKTFAGKRFLQNREAKLIENDKKTLFIRGVNASNVVLTAIKNFVTLKKPNCVFYNRKNEMKPMEDASKLEFFCQKNDASLFMFGSHNKKRPNNLVVGRLFDSHILDMFELGIEDFKAMSDFKTAKFPSGNKPMLLFTEGFDEKPEYKRIKNFFIDFFRGPVIDHINLQGLEHVITFALVNDKILFRAYRCQLKKIEDSPSPSVELTEMGPHMNLTMRRVQIAPDDVFKKSCKKPLQLKHTKVKNISKDTFGSTHGRIHMERQNYEKLQTRKMKGIKKRKYEAENANLVEISSKRPKLELTEE